MDIDTARRCAQDPSGPECEQLLQQKAEEALVDATGMSPETAHAVVECAKTRDREQCAKSSAQIAATYACAAATSGAGTVLCNELAPILIDKMWPVLGPPLTFAWDQALDLVEAIGGALGGMVEEFASILGFGDDGPTETELMNGLVWQGYSVLSPILVAAEEATIKADFESKSLLGLPIPIDGTIGNLPVQPHMPPAARAPTTEVLYQSLRAQPGFGEEVYVLGVKREAGAQAPLPGPDHFHSVLADMEFHVVAPAAADPSILQPDELLIRGYAMPPGWRRGSDTWSPAAFGIVQRGSTTTWRDITAAYTVLLGVRGDSIRKAASTSVGEVVSMNSAQARSEINLHRVDDSSTIWWLLAFTGAAAAAYYYRKPLRKAIGI